MNNLDFFLKNIQLFDLKKYKNSNDIFKNYNQDQILKSIFESDFNDILNINYFFINRYKYNLNKNNKKKILKFIKKKSNKNNHVFFSKDTIINNINILLPKDFLWSYYINLYDDLKHMNEIEAKYHYIWIGNNENRYYKKSKNEIEYINNSKLNINNEYIENIIVITSKIIVSKTIGYSYSNHRSIYTKEERLNQTIQTIHSIRDKFKNINHKILLIDNSDFEINIFNKLNEITDIFLHRHIIDSIDYHTDISKVKGFGEAKQQEIVNNWIVKNKISFKYLFKITGRYVLNDKFNYNKYDNNKCNFKLAVEVMNKIKILNNYYYTSFYKIPYNYFKIYQESISKIAKNEKVLLSTFSYEIILTEFLLKFDKNSIVKINTLGLTQNISGYKKNYYKEQWNV